MLWDFRCLSCGNTEEHWAKRDEVLACAKCGDLLKRQVGGHKMLYFEEGRPRTHWALSDKPITSHSQHRRLMRDNGLAEAGNALPPRMKAKGITPKKEQMREIVAANKGRWF